MDRSLSLQLALALLAGALLNLTPCVLPVMPLKVRSILREAGQTPLSRATSALLFVLGAWTLFVPLGQATALLHLQWGVLFQSRAALLALVAMLLLMAWLGWRGRSLPLPGFIVQAGGGHYVEPYVSGLVSGILSTPCTGPLLGGVLVFALTQPAAHTVALFAAIGSGLALPYVALLLWPGLLQRLPRAGAWSAALHHSFAWLLLAAALFFAQSLLPAWAGAPLWLALLGALAWSMVRLWRRGADRRTRAVALLAVLPVLALADLGTGFLDPGSVHWVALRDREATQLTRLHRPALVEYTAAWCLNCRVLEQTVYADPRVAQALRDRRIVALRADLTRPHANLQVLLVRQGGAGLPFAAVLDAQGREVAHLSGLFDTRSLLRALALAAARATP